MLITITPAVVAFVVVFFVVAVAGVALAVSTVAGLVRESRRSATPVSTRTSQRDFALTR